MKHIHKHDHSAFVLLCGGAFRMHYGKEFNPRGLEIGQAHIGDFSEFGLTEGKYKGAKKRLARLGLASFASSNHGTTMTLSDKAIVYFKPDRQRTGQGKEKKRAEKPNRILKSNGQQSGSKPEKTKDSLPSVNSPNGQGLTAHRSEVTGKERTREHQNSDNQPCTYNQDDSSLRSSSSTNAAEAADDDELLLWCQLIQTFLKHNARGFQQWLKITPKRKRLVHKILNANVSFEDNWEDVFRYVANDRGLRERYQNRGESVKPSADWLLDPETFLAQMERAASKGKLRKPGKPARKNKTPSSFEPALSGDEVSKLVADTKAQIQGTKINSD